jgi:hypothetical protein
MMQRVAIKTYRKRPKELKKRPLEDSSAKENDEYHSSSISNTNDRNKSSAGMKDVKHSYKLSGTNEVVQSVKIASMTDRRHEETSTEGISNRFKSSPSRLASNHAFGRRTATDTSDEEDKENARHDHPSSSNPQTKQSTKPYLSASTSNAFKQSANSISKYASTISSSESSISSSEDNSDGDFVVTATSQSKATNSEVTPSQRRPKRVVQKNSKATKALEELKALRSTPKGRRKVISIIESDDEETCETNVAAATRSIANRLGKLSIAASSGNSSSTSSEKPSASAVKQLFTSNNVQTNITSTLLTTLSNDKHQQYHGKKTNPYIYKKDSSKRNAHKKPERSWLADLSDYEGNDMNAQKDTIDYDGSDEKLGPTSRAVNTLRESLSVTFDNKEDSTVDAVEDSLDNALANLNIQENNNLESDEYKNAVSLGIEHGFAQFTGNSAMLGKYLELQQVVFFSYCHLHFLLVP